MFISIKKIIKSLLEGGLYLIGPKTLHCLNTNNLLILTYHRVLPADHPDLKFEQPGMYVTPETFHLHMTELKRKFELVHLDDWIKAKKNKEKLPKYACAITFDDGWKDNYEYAYPHLKELGIPATIFLVSEYVNTSYSFWPNRLSRFLGSMTHIQLKNIIESNEGKWLKDIQILSVGDIPEKLDSEFINKIIEACKIYSDEEINTYLDGLKNIPLGIVSDEIIDLLYEKEIQEMIESGLVRIGSHTCHHKRLLDSLSDEEIKQEVVASKIHLSTKFSSPVEVFCYPNGDFNKFSLDLVKDNYIAACSTNKGWNNAFSDQLLLKRIGVHEDVSNTKMKFWARLSALI